MIAKGSQRGYGQDHATHLLNAHDNEYIEVAEIRGAIADDLHGAYAEWGFNAGAMTNCKKYIYSLIISPDEKQGRLTREQYDEYIDGAEDTLGLSGQPRSKVYHIKEGEDGKLREHCHVSWSRIDVQDMKAIHIAFDKRKLMTHTKEFALKHGLELPTGYQTGKAKDKPLSLHEKAQQDLTGLTREERQEVITDLWRQSDNAKSFVAALEDHGYMLATGKRPYVLVDTYGKANALPKLINDKTVRQKDIETFLSGYYPTETLPSVEEAQKITKQFYNEQINDKKLNKHIEQLEILKRSQDDRAQKLKHEIAALEIRGEERTRRLKTQQKEKFSILKARHAQDDFKINFERARNAPKGLAGFLAKASGIEFVRKKIHKRSDQKRFDRQFQEKQELELNQQQKRYEQKRHHELQMMELHRKEKAQGKIFSREKKSLKTSHEKDHAVSYRKGHQHMPSLTLTLGPPGRSAMVYKAKNRYYAPTVKELNVKARSLAPEKPVEIRPDFSIAANKDLSNRSGSLKEPNVKFKVSTNERDNGKKR